MDSEVKRIIAVLNEQYPKGDPPILLPPHNPTEIIRGIERTAKPDESVVIAYIKSSKPHWHDERTEVYSVISGELRLHVNDEEFELEPGSDPVTILPGQVHWAEGFKGEDKRSHFSKVKVTCSPAWDISRRRRIPIRSTR